MFFKVNILCLLCLLLKPNCAQSIIKTTIPKVSSDEAFINEKSSRLTLSVDLQKEGFHKLLDYHVNIHEENDAGCVFTLEQNLPASVYVDTDELKGLILRRGYNITLPDFVDVEQPTEKSTTITFLLHFEKKDMFISIPIHFRYHSPGGQSFVPVEIPSPTLYERCPGEVDQKAANGRCFDEAKNLMQKCGWSIRADVALKKNFKEVMIPRGDESIRWLVTYITILVSWIGCASVVYSVRKKTIDLDKKSR